MLENSGATRRDDDALPIDLLKTMVGGAGGKKKNDLTHVEAASITAVDHAAAGDHGSAPPQASEHHPADKTDDPEHPAKISDADRAKIQQAFHNWTAPAVKNGKPGARSSYAQWEKSSLHGTKSQSWSTPDSRHPEFKQARDDYKAAQADAKAANTKAENAGAAVHFLTQHYDGVKTKFDAADKQRGDAANKVIDAVNKVNTAQQHLTEKAGKLAEAAGALDVAQLKHNDLQGKANSLPADHPGRPSAAALGQAGEDLSKAQNTYQKALDEHAAATSAKDAANANRNTANAELKDAAGGLENATSKLDKAKDKLSQAEDEHKKAHDASYEADEKLEQADEDLKQAQKGQKEDEAKTVDADKAYFKNFGKQQGYGVASQLLNDLGTNLAQNEAEKNGNLHEAKWDNVISGGVSVHHDADGGHSLSIGQVNNAGSSKTWHVASGSGAQISTTITAEAGKITMSADGHTTRLDASVSATGSAMASISNMGARVQASVSVAAHADAGAGHVWKHDGHVESVGVDAAVDGTACARAGASLGYDGVSASAGAAAKIVASVTGSASATNGHQSIGGDVQAFATAFAQANAEAKLNLNPFSSEPVEAKCGCNLQAGAGVGVEGTGHLQVVDGLSGDATLGVHVGEIGVKASVDASLQNGDLKLSVDVGAALGIGIHVKFDADINFPKLAEGAADAIRSVGSAVSSAASSVGHFFSSLF